MDVLHCALGACAMLGIAWVCSERRAAITAELVQMLADGTLVTPVEATYALDDVRSALAHHLRPGRAGKILLVS